MRARFHAPEVSGLLNEHFGIQIPKPEPSESLPYRLGRLFGLLERLQLLAYPKVTPNIQDRFWISTSNNPASGFRVPLRMTKTYLAKLPPQYQTSFRQALRELSEGLPLGNLPKSLAPVEQGIFSLGYLHQRTALASSNFSPSA